MNKVKLYLGYAGFCYAKESHAIKGGKNKLIKFHALFGLIQHPAKGWILYDTGYTERFYDATATFPNSIYAALTKVIVTAADEVKHQLKKHGLEPYDIKHIIITHFHADHISGLKDFKQAIIYCSKKAFEQVNNIHPLLGFTKGILKSLLPEDIKTRTRFIEDECEQIPDKILGVKYDLFNDQYIYITQLEGHAAGQIGVLITTEKNSYFLIADACWLSKSFEQMILPSPVVKLFFNSWKDYKISLQKVHDYHTANPKTIIVPTHCYKTTSTLVSCNNLVNEL